MKHLISGILRQATTTLTNPKKLAGHCTFITLAGLFLLTTIINCFAASASPVISNHHENARPLRVISGYQTQQTKSLWQVIINGYQLGNDRNNPKVRYYVNYYREHPDIVEILARRSILYLYDIVQQVEARHMPTEIALLPFIESGFQPRALSDQGALGMWQLMPATAKRFDVTEDNWWFHGRQNLAESTKAALNYLQFLYRLFHRHWLIAIAAYNAGEGRVQRAIDRNVSKGLPNRLDQLNLPKETKNYPYKLLAFSMIIENAKRYGIKLPTIPNTPLVKRIKLPQQMELIQIAELADISLPLFRTLNAAYAQIATPPFGTHYIVLPIAKVATFNANYRDFPKSQLRQWQRYIVRSGDTLSKIARLTDNTVAELKQNNRLQSHLIDSGQSLLYLIKKNYHVYTVEAGDNLTHIARLYDVPLSQLMRWNRLNNQSILHIGQKLIIR